MAERLRLLPALVLLPWGQVSHLDPFAFLSNSSSSVSTLRYLTSLEATLTRSERPSDEMTNFHEKQQQKTSMTVVWADWATDASRCSGHYVVHSAP